jgi:hypothetical protein
MTAPFGHGEVWGDGAGAAQALGAVFATGAGAPLEIGAENELVCLATVDVADCDAIEFRVDWHPDPTAGFGRWPLPAAASAGGVETQEPRLIQVPGTIGTHALVLRAPPNGYVEVQARAVNLGAGATLYVEGYARLPGYGDVLGGAGGSSDALSALSGPTLCWSAIAPGLGAGLLAAVPCAESLEATNRWHAIPAGCRFVRFTAISSGAAVPLPTGIVLQPMYSDDAGATAKPIPLVKSVVNRVALSTLIAEYSGADGAATRADGWLEPLLVDRTEIPASATHVELRAAKNGGGATAALLGYVAFEG